MTELTFRGVHSDGEHLQLSDAAGNDYLLLIDESLYAAIRAHRLESAAQKQQRHGQQVRPRDIQAMIRSGMTAEEVADATGESLEHIRRYEHPVLAERGHISRQARETLVYPDSSPDDSPSPLVRLCEERLKLRDVDIETMSWDAWKQNSGSWYVELSFIAADRRRRAGWEYSRGSMIPLDDEARWLADSGPTDSGPIPNYGSGSERAYNAEHQDSSGSDATPLRDHQAETGRILESLRRRRSRSAETGALDSQNPRTDGPVPGVDPAEAAADAPVQPVPQQQSRGRLHAVADAPAARPDGAHTALSAPEEADDAGRLPLPAEQPGSSQSAAPGGAAQSTFDIFDDQPSLLDEPGVSDGRNSTQPIMTSQPDAPQAGSPAAAEPTSGGSASGSAADSGESAEPAGEEPKKKNGRSSVPSWDEIMFGTKRD
ncbi:septation protein SepH [Brevibacterium gallinarum]|uniref:DUF3071 domain-containing protein n=1 Tax=Brevibacterium gallinarum TaxID=2762220 RepID=A0ABR8WSW9_9MICO|nr:septation protein SepH [Brevibacterium gallinarum]MBD8020170.1 DUF3071 domain-containing protein [Brevibacterium gallinarum]